MLVHLHIGLDKTGSTAIQNNIWLNRQWYADRGMFVPNTGFNRVGHQRLFKEFFPNNLDPLRKELKGATSFGFKDFFISWEGIHTLEPERLEQLKGLFPEYEFKIHVFLREQSEILQSGLLQQVKHGTDELTLEEAKNNKGFLTHKNRDYERVLGKFARLFGAESISAHVYDKKMLPDGNVIKGLLASMGLELDEEFVFKKQASNISVDVPSAIIINEMDRDLNLTDIEHERLVDKLLNDIAINGSHEKYFLSKQSVDFIKQHFLQSNRKVVETYLGSDWPYPDLFPYEKNTYAVASEDDIAAIIEEKKQKLVTLERYLTWGGKVLSGVELAQLTQPDYGWTDAGSDGSSQCGELSHIYFRPFWKNVESKHMGLRLLIENSFSTSGPAPEIAVNGSKAEELHSPQHEIVIPLEKMDEYYRVDIDISNARQPGQTDQDGLKIHSLQYELLKS
jgi:hypothetical protein